MKCSPADCSVANRVPRSKRFAWEGKKCGPLPAKPSANWDGRRSQSTMRFAAPSSGFRLTDMPKIAIVAALEREIAGLINRSSRTSREYENHKFIFFEQGEMVIVCGGIGAEAARRAAEAMIALYQPALVISVGFAGALDADLRVGEIFSPAGVLDARDGSRFGIDGGTGVVV